MKTMKKLLLLVALIATFVSSSYSQYLENLETESIMVYPKSSAPSVGPLGSAYVGVDGTWYRSNGTTWVEMSAGPVPTLDQVMLSGNMTQRNLFMQKSNPSLTLSSYGYNTDSSFGLSSNQNRDNTITFLDIDNNKAGRITYEHDNHRFSFMVDNIEKMRLSSTGLDLLSNSITTTAVSPISSKPGSVNATNGKVLTANGTGGSSWSLPQASNLTSVLNEGNTTDIKPIFNNGLQVGNSLTDGYLYTKSTDNSDVRLMHYDTPSGVIRMGQPAEANISGYILLAAGGYEFRASITGTGASGMMYADYFHIVPQASIPSSVQEGTIYSNSVDHNLYYYNSSAWKKVSFRKSTQVLSLPSVTFNPANGANATVDANVTTSFTFEVSGDTEGIEGTIVVSNSGEGFPQFTITPGTSTTIISKSIALTVPPGKYWIIDYRVIGGIVYFVSENTAAVVH